MTKVSEDQLKFLKATVKAWIISIKILRKSFSLSNAANKFRWMSIENWFISTF